MHSKLLRGFKRALAAALAVLLPVLSLAACGPAGDAGESSPVRVAAVLTFAGLGDMNFNDMAYEGLLRAQEDFGIEFDYVEPKTFGDYPGCFRRYAEAGTYDLIIGLSYEQGTPLVGIADEFPEQKYCIIDPALEHPSIHAVSTNRQDQFFLCGALAGLGTLSAMPQANEENVVGVILGQDNPDIQAAAQGFEAGARYVNPEVRILSAVTDGFSNPASGHEVARDMYQSGADFIQHMAGASGLGVIRAAKETGNYVLGTGSNQNYIEPDYIVATAIRNVDDVVYNEVRAVVQGTWQPGVTVLGLQDAAVGFTTEKSNVRVPADILAAIEDIRAAILAGELELPTGDNMEYWLATHRYNAKGGAA